MCEGCMLLDVDRWISGKAAQRVGGPNRMDGKVARRVGVTREVAREVAPEVRRKPGRLPAGWGVRERVVGRVLQGFRVEGRVSTGLLARLKYS